MEDENALGYGKSFYILTPGIREGRQIGNNPNYTMQIEACRIFDDIIQWQMQSTDYKRLTFTVNTIVSVTLIL